ncbi:IS110 family RNA-guided transposase [Limnoglobus roseus]|uniref:IS110 family transposase n=1 Tax=Limnoglobus roseus TaxID=2598579 RepID=A0A5C1AGK5_9BACT|nr:IS110 family transposase [Limnoglobus roseus]QEL16710.1 IS110 family transposase [Limnoglobus roseus]QEL17775.1 IS110 family transposase [Limnoglobus roseus]QEL18843.1 IS110 family transposase [Limnoglobus roseus]QEL19013.1 IS110 family transposase [Limnoglobus roseus]
MRFIGLDLHKKMLVVCALDDRGQVLFRETVECRREALEAFARVKLQATDRLAAEATTNTWAVADILRPFVAAVTVGNPLQIKAIAQAKVKTDKIDAEVLAHLLRCDYLPTVWTPDAATQKLRQLTTVRGGVIADRTRIKNRVQSLLAQLLVVPPVKVVFCRKGVAWLRAVALPAEVRSAVDLYLRLYDAVDAELKKIDDQLMGMAYDDGRAKLLMTLPGIAHGVALSLLAALGDIGRFPDGDHAASYLGLTPRLRQSAGKRHYGGITKAGCPQTRAMLVQAVQAASDHPGPIGAFFRRLRKKKKYNVAVIATARKLVTIAYLMLKHNEPYRYAKLDVVKNKLTDCRRKAGSASRSEHESDGSRLNDLYREHGLPACQPPAAWSAGERRGHADPAVTAFAEEAHGPPAKKSRSKRRASTTSE